MVASIISSLGAGSGLDTTALVRDLAAAARAPREEALNAASSRTTAQLSALSSARGALDTFSDALDDAVTARATDPAGQDPAAFVPQLLRAFTTAYNSLRSALNRAVAPGADGASGGPLAGDAGVRALQRDLSAMMTTPLAGEGSLTLAELGVRTNRDGTLAIDATRLTAVVTADPEAVRRTLAPTSAEDPAQTQGISAVLRGVKKRMTATGGPLAQSQLRYEQTAKRHAKARTRLAEDDARYQAALQRSFTTMDRRMSVLRAGQTQLQQQVAMWTKSTS